MLPIPSHITQKLAALADKDALRSLHLSQTRRVDFTTNAYLGMAAKISPAQGNAGAGDSRLLSGHLTELVKLEAECAIVQRQKVIALRAQLESGLTHITGLTFIPGNSPVCPIIIPGNKQIKSAAAHLQAAGFDVPAILAPTVAAGAERLHIILHSYNTTAEIAALLFALQNWQNHNLHQPINTIHSKNKSNLNLALNG